MISVQKVAAYTGHSGAIYALVRSLNSNEFFSGSSDKLVAGWNIDDASHNGFTAGFPAPVYSLLLEPVSGFLTAGTGAGSIHFIDLKKKQEMKILQLHQTQVFDLAFSPKYNVLFSAGGDGQMAVTDMEAQSMQMIRKLCSEKVRNIRISPDESMLAVASGDGMIRIFSLPDMNEIRAFHAHQLSANALCWHPSGNFLISGGRDAMLKFYDVQKDFSEIKAVPAHNYAIYSIVFSPDQKYFATGSRDKTVKIWDAGNFDFLLRINKEKHEGHINSVNTLLWHDNGLLFSAGDDRTVISWDIQ